MKIKVFPKVKAPTSSTTTKSASSVFKLMRIYSLYFLDASVSNSSKYANMGNVIRAKYGLSESPATPLQPRPVENRVMTICTNAVLSTCFEFLWEKLNGAMNLFYDLGESNPMVAPMLNMVFGS